MNIHAGVLTRSPYKHPGGKVAYCSLSTMDEDFELVVFRKKKRAYDTLLSLAEGDVVEVRGNKHIDKFQGKDSKQLIVEEIAKERIEKLEDEVSVYDLDIEEF